MRVSISVSPPDTCSPISPSQASTSRGSSPARGGNRSRKGSLGCGDRDVFGSQELDEMLQKRRNVLTGFEGEDNATQDVGRFERPRDQQKITGRFAHELTRHAARKWPVSVLVLERAGNEKLIIVLVRRGDNRLSGRRFFDPAYCRGPADRLKEALLLFGIERCRMDNLQLCAAMPGKRTGLRNNGLKRRRERGCDSRTPIRDHPVKSSLFWASASGISLSQARESSGIDPPEPASR